MDVDAEITSFSSLQKNYMKDTLTKKQFLFANLIRRMWKRLNVPIVDAITRCRISNRLIIEMKRDFLNHKEVNTIFDGHLFLV